MARAGRAVPGLVRELDRHDITLDAIEVHRPTLDDVFLTLTGRSLRDAETEKPEQPAERDRDDRDPRRARRSDPMTFARESFIVFRRQIRMNLRNPAWVFIGALQPVLYLLLFGPLLKPLVSSFPGGSENALEKVKKLTEPRPSGEGDESIGSVDVDHCSVASEGDFESKY